MAAPQAMVKGIQNTANDFMNNPQKVLQKAHLHYLPPMPKLVINYGTAGSRDLPIGELVDCTKFVQRDMNITQ